MFLLDEQCPLIENTEREHVANGGRYARYRGYRYYGGHYGYDVYTQVAEGHLAVTCFREPADRLLSLHTYFRHHVALPEDKAETGNLYPVAFAHRCEFSAFVSSEDPRIELHTRNHHARQMTGSGWAADDDIDMDRAIKMVETMPWFYVCAHPTLSQAWGDQVFGEAFGVIGHENTTVRGTARAAETMDRSARAAIAAKNTRDSALHRRAICRLLR